MPPRVLAIDVTGPGGGAALLGPGGVETRLLGPGIARGRDLVPLVAKLLAEASLAPADVDLVACAVGPGSFTGIRIGIATAATLAYAAGVPVLDVGSLHGIAAGAPEGHRDVLVALDARRGRVFTARFVDGKLSGEYGCLPAEEAARNLDAGTCVLGDAREKYPHLFGTHGGVSQAPVRPDVLAAIAAERFERGERLDPAELRPLYLRLSDPELKRLGDPG